MREKPIKKTEKAPLIIDKEYYDEQYFYQYPEYFDYAKSKFQRYRIKNVMKIYTPRSHETVLDMGLGWGTFTFYTAEFCRSVVGLDFSFASVWLCSQRMKDKPDKPNENISLICADVQAVPLLDESFDVILSADLVEHLYPDQFDKFVEESHRLLKKRGKLILWTPNQGHWTEHLRKSRILFDSQDSHVDYKSMESIKKTLAQQGFQILKAYYVESHLPGIQIIEKMLLRYVPLFRRRIAILGEKI